MCSVIQSKLMLTTCTEHVTDILLDSMRICTCTMLATCFLLSSSTELSDCCAMHTLLNVSKPRGRSVKNLHSIRSTKALASVASKVSSLPHIGRIKKNV